jgi:chemotaxis family two-component system response regulator Rcp1
MTNGQFEVLLVEDDEGDVELTRKALQNNKLKVNLLDVNDGEQALLFLRRQGQYANAPRPDLILLDLNMPRKDGRQVLSEIKNDPDLKSIPVVVLTTSAAETDILQSYNLGCNCYATKPVGFKEFTNIVKNIESFWFTVIQLPPKV